MIASDIITFTSEASLQALNCDGYLKLEKYLNSQRVWQVEGDAAGHVLPVLEVAVEADGDVEAGHDGHGGVEDAVPALHVHRGPHLVLQRQHDADALEGVDGGAEVERELGPGRHVLPLRDVGDVLQPDM